MTIYFVQIRYREPTYWLRGRGRAEPYSWIYQVEADSLAEAKTLALREFRSTERLSWVGWVREVVSMEQIDLLPEDVVQI